MPKSSFKLCFEKKSHFKNHKNALFSNDFYHPKNNKKSRFGIGTPQCGQNHLPDKKRTHSKNHQKSLPKERLFLSKMLLKNRSCVILNQALNFRNGNRDLTIANVFCQGIWHSVFLRHIQRQNLLHNIVFVQLQRFCNQSG